MKRYWMFYIFLLAGFGACTFDGSDLTRQEVIDVISQFDSGWQHKKMNLVDAALSNGYTYFTQSGGIFSRDSVVATAGESDYTLKEMSRSEFDIAIHGNTAIVSSRWKGKGKYRGVIFNEDQRCSIVVIKKDNKVEILSEHCTPIRKIRIFH